MLIFLWRIALNSVAQNIWFWWGQKKIFQLIGGCVVKTTKNELAKFLKYKKPFTRSFLRGAKSTTSVYEFETSDAKLSFSEDPTISLSTIPQSLPLGCNFLEFTSSGDDLIDFFAANVRLWILDYLNSDSFDRWDLDDYTRITVNLGASPILTDFLLDLNSKSTKSLIAHFGDSFYFLVEKQKEKEIQNIQSLRESFNKKILSGAENLTDIEIRFLSGLVASSGYLHGVVEFDNIQFLESISISEFQKNHYSYVAMGEVENAVSPSGNLFASFLIDIVTDRSDKSWKSSSLMLGSPILEKLPNTITTKGLRKAARGYEIKSENLAKIDDVILDVQIKSKLINLVDFFKHQSEKSGSAALRILLRGVSGCGKSMLSQAIAEHLCVSAIAVNLSTCGTDNLFFTLSTFIERARKNRMVLVLEECEQLLSVNPYTNRNDDAAKIMFEDYDGIVIFTTNTVATDKWFAPTEAIERRMDLIVDFEIPGPEHRKRILDQELKKWIKDGWTTDITDANTTSLAKETNLSGGFFPQALKQAASAGLDRKLISLKNLEESLRYVSEKSRVSRHTESAAYSDIKLNQVVLSEKNQNAIMQVVQYYKKNSDKERNPILPQGTTVLFSGPSGVGKSLAAQAIANELGLKIRTTTASDFLSMFVGGTEKNIKSLFSSAEAKKELLFIDEVEGLLHSREISQRSWETTQVNEFLKAIENFKGLLICATNNPEMMDFAFSRRFLFNIKFEFPNENQRCALWRQYLSGRNLEEKLIQKLATRYEFSGGEIRNIAVRIHLIEAKTWSEFESLCNELESSRLGEKPKRIGIN